MRKIVAWGDRPVVKSRTKAIRPVGPTLIRTFAFLLPLLAWPLFAQDKNSDIQIGEKFNLKSEILNEQRTYSVYLPASYNDRTYALPKYPVLYLLDGDSHFHSASGVVQFMSTGINGNIQIPELIVVAIPNTNRTRDLTPTHSMIGADGKEAAFLKVSGGGDAFLRFIREELFPRIDSAYRTLPYRIFVGHSFGGLIGLHAMLTRPDMFQSYIAMDPSLWWDNRLLVRNVEKGLKGQKRETSVYLSLANNPDLGGGEGPAMKEAGRSFAKSLESVAGIRSKLQYFEEEDHGSVPLISLYHGLLHIFDGYKPSLQVIFQQPGSLKTQFASLSERLGVEMRPPGVFVDQMGLALLEQFKNVEKAIELLQLNVMNFPESSRAYESLARAYVAKGETDSAIRHYERAVELNPSNKNLAGRLQKLKAQVKQE